MLSSASGSGGRGGGVPSSVLAKTKRNRKAESAEEYEQECEELWEGEGEREDGFTDQNQNYRLVIDDVRYYQNILFYLKRSIHSHYL